MIPYCMFRPTQYDVNGLGCEDQQDWLVAPCSRTRDSETLSNWETQEKLLREADPECEDHETHRFGHWGPGWFEIVLVRPGSAAAEKAESIECSLSDYPILDESDYSEKEAEASEKYWKYCSCREKQGYLRKAGLKSRMAIRRILEDGDVPPYYHGKAKKWKLWRERLDTMLTEAVRG